MLSFWDTESFFQPVDVAVVGSGIVGLSAAIHLKQRAPHLKVSIIEKGPSPAGASNSNAGFACFGSLSELLDDIENGAEEEAVLALAKRRHDGLLRLREKVGDANMCYEPLGGHEIFTDQGSLEKCLEQIPHFNQKMEKALGVKNVYSHLSISKTQEYGFSGVKGMIFNKAEGQIHTGKMMETLVALARQHGVRILNGIDVARVEEHTQGCEIVTAKGFALSARQVLFCTNGYTARLLPELQVEPARNQVLITSPIEGLPFRGAFHYEQGYYYFRNVGDRILLGGGRHLDKSGERTDIHGLTDHIYHAQMALLQSVVIPGRAFTIERRWAGILGVGALKRPIVQRISERQTVAVRMGGMGVAIGTLVGEEGAEVVLSGEL